MTTRAEEIKQTLMHVSENVNSLTMLMEFEKILDSMNIFAYKNWFNGELVKGPDISRYWFTTTWMFPHKSMPDPKGGLRLVKYGCKVFYKKSKFVHPVKVHGPEDLQNPITKKPKFKKIPVWLITIEMPRHFIDDKIDDYLSMDQLNTLDVDTSDISNMYDESTEVDENMETNVDMGGMGEELE